MAKWCVKLGEHWVGAERRRWALWRQKYWSWQKSQPQSLSLTWLTLIGFINSQIKMEECQHQGEINKFLFSWQKFQTPTDRKTGWMQHRILWSVSHCSFFILEIFILVWHYMKKSPCGWGDVLWQNGGQCFSSRRAECVRARATELTYLTHMHQ